MTDNQSSEWDALDGEQPRPAADVAMDELGLETPPKRSRGRGWLWLLVPALIGAGILAWWVTRDRQEPLPFEERADAFGYEQLEQTRLPSLAGMERIEVARAPEPAIPDRTPPSRTPPERTTPEVVRPAPGVTAPNPHVAVNPNVRVPGPHVVPDGPATSVPPVRVNPTTPPDVTVRPDVGVPGPDVAVPGPDVAVGPTTTAPGVGVSPDVPVQPDVAVPDGPAVVEPDNPSPPPGVPDGQDPAEVVVPDATGPTTRDSQDPAEVVVPDVAVLPEDPTTRHAVEPGADSGVDHPTGWKLEGLAHTEPMDPGQDPRQSVPKPPEYFKPENMRDGFLILSQLANQGAWRLNRDDLYVREFHTPDGKSCVDFIWPGEGHLKDAEGTLAPEASFWIRPRQKRGNYSRYFDNQKADFYHWVGIEIPPEQKDKAAEMFEWKLASPKMPPPGWQPAGKVYEYKRGDKTRYMYVYQMPMGPLSSGVTNVDLRLYHKESGAYLGKNSHSVTIGGTTP